QGQRSTDAKGSAFLVVVDIAVDQIGGIDILVLVFFEEGVVIVVGNLVFLDIGIVGIGSCALLAGCGLFLVGVLEADDFDFFLLGRLGLGGRLGLRSRRSARHGGGSHRNHHARIGRD